MLSTLQTEDSPQAPEDETDGQTDGEQPTDSAAASAEPGRDESGWRAALPKIRNLSSLMVYSLVFGFCLALQKQYAENLIFQKKCFDRFAPDGLPCYQASESGNVTQTDLVIFGLVRDSSFHVFALRGTKLLAEALASCFLCAWSDFYGRKTPLLVATVGENFEVVSYLLSYAPYDYFICVLYVLSFVSGMLGGWTCAFAMIYCSVTSLSTPETRALCFASISFALTAGIICGTHIAKKYILENIALVTMATITVLRLLSIAWILLTLPDKRFTSNSKAFWSNIKKVFHRHHVNDTFKAVLRWRRNCETSQLFLLILSTFAVLISYPAIEGVTLTNPFHAQLFENYQKYKDYTFYMALFRCLTEPFFILGTYYLRFEDTTIGIIGFFNLYLSSFIIGYAKDFKTFVAGLAVAPVKGFLAISIQSAYSKIAGSQELGKVFYVYALSEVTAFFFSYLIFERLKIVLTKKDELLPNMIICMLLVLPLSTCLFQVLSIQTATLMQECYNLDPVRFDDTRRQAAASPPSSETEPKVCCTESFTDDHPSNIKELLK